MYLDDLHYSLNCPDAINMTFQVINYLGNKKPLIGSVQSKTRRTMKVVQSVRGEGCGGHSIVHWNNVPLIVPPVPPSRLDGCNIIDVQYLIRVSSSI